MSDYPVLYEINTRCWLGGLSTRAGRPLTLAEIPDAEFDFWQRCGFTHIWLMGVWTLGDRSIRKSRQKLHTPLDGPAFGEAEGSPYAIASYEVSPALGGRDALEHFRHRLNARGLRLLLDFVPNHTGHDHVWVRQHPEFYITTEKPLHDSTRPYRDAPRWFACGSCRATSDAWHDTLQLDHRNPELRRALIAELLRIAEWCDGVRCDMAMLVLNEVFEAGWGSLSPHPRPGPEFWTEAIGAVRAKRPAFLFLAEAYWDREAQLQELGFDFTYDKRLYDRLIAHDGPGAIRYLQRLAAQFVERSAHFLENHDEPRIASLVSPAEHRASALLTFSLPGMRFVHEGQLAGCRVKTNLHFSSRTREVSDAAIFSFYEKLFDAMKNSAVGHGDWSLLTAQRAWAGNATHENIALLQWRRDRDSFDLAVANLGATQGQCYAPLAVPELACANWRLTDLLGTEVHERDGKSLAERGLYLDLPPHAAQLFHFDPVR